MINLRRAVYQTLKIVLATCWVLLWYGCKYTKHLTDKQIMLNKNVIHVKTLKPVKYKGEFESAIFSLISPQANTHIFDVDMLPKYKLWKYNNRFKYYQLHDTDKKIVKRKVEKPILLDTAAVRRSAGIIRQYLLNQGFYYAKVSARVDSVGYKLADVHFEIETGPSYYIRKISVEVDDPQSEHIFTGDPNTYLKAGDVFTNVTCGFERDRIYRKMQQEGFFDFKSENVTFLLDTTNKDAILRLLDDPFDVGSQYDIKKKSNQDSADVKIIIAATKDSNYLRRYEVDSVYVDLIDKHTPIDPGTPFKINPLEEIVFRYQTLPVNRKVIARNIFIQPGERYNPKDKELTINRLNQLNVFQFVNITYEKTAVPGKLICFIKLDMLRKREYLLNLDANTTDADYYFGFGTGVQYRDRNLFHGANQLSIKTSVSAQFRNDTLFNDTKQIYLSGNNINVNASLAFPKFIVPFVQNRFNKKNVPFTLLGFNYNYLLRRENYTIKNASASYGYTWKETDQKNWRFNPAFLTLTFVPERFLSEEFLARRKQSAYLSSIFSSNIIYGENVNLEYRSKEKGLYKSSHSIKIGLEEAGTILRGINSVYKGITNSEIEPISNYLRSDIDYRNYQNRRKSQWVNRVLLGVGLPLWQSNSLPYIKQYSAGGAFSLRGFQARTVGPGRSSDSSYVGNNLLIDRTGDIKFEANTEYRFNLLKIFSGAFNLKGACFVDAGNIWLFQSDPGIPGGEFQWNYVLKDLAVCTGLGLRLDFSYAVIRVDAGYPIKRPGLNNGYGFQLSQLNYWKDANFVIGFGYPF